MVRRLESIRNITIHNTDRYTDMVNELATVGEDPNQFNEYGEAPLCVAADKGLGMVVAELLQRDNIQVRYNNSYNRSRLNKY